MSVLKQRSGSAMEVKKTHRPAPSGPIAAGRADREYNVRAIGTSPLELKTVAELCRIVWPRLRHLTPDYLSWQYAENPCGPVIGFNAWAGHTLAAHYAVIPIRAAIHGVVVDAALSLNTAVHPDHQRRGLFIDLAERTYQLAEDRGVHHIVGVANANSTHGLVKRLGFDLIGPLDVRVLWRSPRRVGARGDAPPSWQRIWEPHDLEWRLRNPSASYRLSRRAGRLQVLAHTHIPGMRAILKLESSAEAGSLENARLGTSHGLFVRLWMGRSTLILIPTGSGLPVPDWLKPSPLNLIMRRLRKDSRPIDPARVEFEAIDFDAY